MSDVTPLCLLLLLLLFDLPPRPAALTANQKRRIVEKHNDYRSKPQPLAADMKALTWDKTLEQLATSYAAKCIWDHNEERGFRGENLFIMSGSNLDVDMGLDDWHRERDFYNFTANTCAEGQMCGHYTQMVWAGTERVGCGEKFCETLDGFEFGNMTLLVCNYEPPGNFEGEQPFSVGEPCSACPPTHRCQDTLCVDLEQKESSTEAPDTASAQTPDAASEPAPDATAVIDLATVVLQPHIITAKPEAGTTTSPPTASTSTVRPDASIAPSTSTVPPDASTAPSTSTVPPGASTAPSTSTVPPGASTAPSMSTVPPGASTTMTPVPETTQLEQVLDVTPTSTGSSVVGSLQTLEDSSPKIAVETLEGTSEDVSIPPAVSSTTPSLKNDQVVSSPDDKTFSNDGPDTPGSMPPPPEKVDSGPVDKGPPKDGTIRPPTKAPTLKSLLVPTTQDAKKKQKDEVKRPQDTPSKTDGKAGKVKPNGKQNSRQDFLPKKYQMSKNALSKAMGWGYKSGASDGTYFGTQFYSPPIGQTHRPPCPYPCLNSPFKFPLYRANNPSSWGGPYQMWPASKLNGKKPCKQAYGYKSAVYSLYRPSSYLEDNLTEPKRHRRFWR